MTESTRARLARLVTMLGIAAIVQLDLPPEGPPLVAVAVVACLMPLGLVEGLARAVGVVIDHLKPTPKPQ